MIKIYIDGASAGNPGKVGIGYIIYQEEVLVKKESIYLGIQTNNFAEYMAFIFALTEALQLPDKKVEVFSDSQLLCEQLKGAFKVKNKNLYPLYVLAKKLIMLCGHFNITHIDRELNKEADKLAGEAVDFLM